MQYNLFRRNIKWKLDSSLILRYSSNSSSACILHIQPLRYLTELLAPTNFSVEIIFSTSAFCSILKIIACVFTMMAMLTNCAMFYNIIKYMIHLTTSEINTILSLLLPTSFIQWNKITSKEVQSKIMRRNVKFIT